MQTVASSTINMLAQHDISDDIIHYENCAMLQTATTTLSWLNIHFTEDSVLHIYNSKVKYEVFYSSYSYNNCAHSTLYLPLHLEWRLAGLSE